MAVRYGLKTHGVWRTPWWNAKEGDTRKLRHAEDVCYGDMDEGLFAELLDDELDVPDYELTPENVKREFGYDRPDAPEISGACIERILEYYRFRTALRDRLRRTFLDSRSEAMLAAAGASSASFRYVVPPAGNNFSCEDPDYDGGQEEAWVEVTIETAPSPVV